MQARLEGDGAGGPPTIADPAALLRHLDVSGHFHRDGRAGRLFHRGMISLRENVPTDSLHVSIDGNHLSAHVDAISPLDLRSRDTTGYAPRRALMHNVAGIAQDLSWLLRGRQGDHGCELDCEWVSAGSRRPPDAPGATPEQRERTPAGSTEPPAGPASVQLEARVAGSLDEARLRAALAVVLGASARERLEVVDCAEDEDLRAARVRLQRVDVALEAPPPAHVQLARHAAGDVLMLNLNHAAVDGFGALRVLQAVARAYAGDADGAVPLDLLACSDLPVRPARSHASFASRATKRGVERVRDALSAPARLAAEQPGAGPEHGFHLVTLPAGETQRVSPDDGGCALMAALHLTIGLWNRRRGTAGRRIGVLMPADLRPPEWPQELIGNFSVNARMSTDRRDRRSPSAALRATAAQAKRNDRTRTGIALIAALQRAGLLALWAKQSVVVLRPVTTNRDVDTAMLCDLGTLDDEAPCFGEDAGELLELWFSTPSRSPLSLCLGAVTIAGRLQLTFRYPHRLFDAAAAGRFADLYVEQLRLVASVGPRPRLAAGLNRVRVSRSRRPRPRRRTPSPDEHRA